MNFASLQNLFARIPPIRYQSPAVCEGEFSSSGSATIVLPPIDRLASPSGIIFGSPGHPFRLSWSTYPGAICFSVYRLADEFDPFSEFILIAECISDNFIDLDTWPGAGIPGQYVVTAITREGETAPSIKIVYPDPLLIETDALESGEVDKEYSQILVASGGSPGGPCGYVWSLLAGTLPEGLSLDSCAGEILGTPTEDGIFPLTIKVTDARGVTATREFSLEIEPAFPEPKTWWKLDEAFGNLVDSVNGVELGRHGTVTSAPGLYANGVVITTPAAATQSYITTEVGVVPMSYFGAGWTLTFAMQFPGGHTGDATVLFELLNNAGGNFFYNAGASGFEFFGPGGLYMTAPFAPSAGTWYLIRIFFDGDAGKIGVQIDDNPAVFSSGFIANPAADSEGIFSISVSDSNSVLLDEMAYWPLMLTEDQWLELVNDGNWRTFPLDL